MKHIKYTCDKCEKEINDGVLYKLTCYAEDVPAKKIGYSMEAAVQNNRQNMALQTYERHLCKACKDAITDGIFIL
jgi:uncharacterized protein YbaA (DUF1428 family)